VESLSGVAVAVCGDLLPDSVAALCEGVTPDEGHKRIGESLKNAGQGLLLLGNIANRHRAYSAVRALAAAVADATGAKLGYLSEGANAAGACLAGLLPHRGPGGSGRAEPGLNAGNMLDDPLDVLLLVGIEPDADFLAVAGGAGQVAAQSFSVAMTPFVSDALLYSADLLLPVGTFAESSGTYINVAGTWQSFPGIASPVGESRPAWKVLRVIGNLLEASDFDYVSSEDIRDEIAASVGEFVPDNTYTGGTSIAKPNGEDAPDSEIDLPIYSVDGMVRRASALQLTAEARRARDEDGAS
jgi:NADH-quinone oxidoreductase subunit G